MALTCVAISCGPTSNRPKLVTLVLFTSPIDNGTNSSPLVAAMASGTTLKPLVLNTSITRSMVKLQISSNCWGVILFKSIFFYDLLQQHFQQLSIFV